MNVCAQLVRECDLAMGAPIRHRTAGINKHAARRKRRHRGEERGGEEERRRGVDEDTICVVVVSLLFVYLSFLHRLRVVAVGGALSEWR